MTPREWWTNHVYEPLGLSPLRVFTLSDPHVFPVAAAVPLLTSFKPLTTENIVTGEPGEGGGSFKRMEKALLRSALALALVILPQTVVTAGKTPRLQAWHGKRRITAPLDALPYTPCILARVTHLCAAAGVEAPEYRGGCNLESIVKSLDAQRLVYREAEKPAIINTPWAEPG